METYKWKIEWMTTNHGGNGAYYSNAETVEEAINECKQEFMFNHYTGEVIRPDLKITDIWKFIQYGENFKEEKDMNRIDIVMKALKVDEEDAKTIVEHLIKQECEEWIDDYRKDERDEPLTDVHYEKSFDDMIDWQYEDSKPSEILGKPTDIEKYPEMLQLKDKVIFWYGLV